MWYFKIVSNFTRLMAREITYNVFDISLMVFMLSITPCYYLYQLFVLKNIFCTLCNMMAQHIRRISTLSNVQYMYSIHQHKRSPLKIKFAAAACDQSCCMDEISWCWVRLKMIYWHQSCFMDLLFVRRNNYLQAFNNLLYFM